MQKHQIPYMGPSEMAVSTPKKLKPYVPLEVPGCWESKSKEHRLRKVSGEVDGLHFTAPLCA